MGKNDFDIDFDFEDEYGFDPKAFLGTEEYDDNVNLNEFSDEELGLTSHTKPEAEDDAANSGFDLDADLDDFLNIGSEEDTPEDEWPEEPRDDFGEEPEFGEEEPEENYEESADESQLFDEDYDENTEYSEEEQMEPSDFDDEPIQEEDMSEQESVQTRQRKPREQKEVKKPKITLPKLKVPNFFTKFFDLYFAPLLHKEMREEPQDPNNPRRRRRKSRSQIFKEVYLPPIIACMCLILVMSFVIGSLSNVIAQRRIDKETHQSQLDASASAAELQAEQNQRIVEEAAELAAGYDYNTAIEKLDSIGDLTQYPEIAAKRAEYDTARNALVEYKDPTLIPNLSFHVLIEDMARAKQDSEWGGSYNKNFVTTGEFSKILNQLYANDFVLVDFNSFVAANTDLNGNEKFMPNSLWLPPNKKPVMITETMVNYFNYMLDADKDGKPDTKGTGFANKLVLDANGDIKAEYLDASGQTLVGNYDLVPILEDFIKEHPDFSYRGARAILAVTGHEGVFGYRCNTSYIASVSQQYYDEQVAGAKQITQALRDKGYTIACYTYKNDPYAGLSVTQIQTDMTNWATQVVSVIGQVDTFVFAKGSRLTDYNGNAFKVMHTSGFRYFISSDTTPYTEINDTYVRQNRLMVTGENMQHKSSQFTNLGLFDPNAVLELSTRGSVPTG